MHRAEQVRPCFKRKGHEYPRIRNMVLEPDSLQWREWRAARRAVELLHQITFAITFHPVPEDEIVHAPANVDRVDLDEAVMPQGARHIR